MRGRRSEGRSCFAIGAPLLDTVLVPTICVPTTDTTMGSAPGSDLAVVARETIATWASVVRPGPADAEEPPKETRPEGGSPPRSAAEDDCGGGWPPRIPRLPLKATGLRVDRSTLGDNAPPPWSLSLRRPRSSGSPNDALVAFGDIGGERIFELRLEPSFILQASRRSRTSTALRNCFFPLRGTGV